MAPHRASRGRRIVTVFIISGRRLRRLGMTECGQVRDLARRELARLLAAGDSDRENLGLRF
jgi:hypothetical protein